jgi:predicted hydrolase (HD superfamily)
MNRQDAQKLLEEWVKSDSLRKHCLGVAVCMEAYAKKYLEEGELCAVEDAVELVDNDKSSLVLTGNDGQDVKDDGSKFGVDNNSKDGDGNDNQIIIDRWYICGLLHDFDYERYPALEEHPKKGCEFLKENSYPTDIIEAIMGHGNHTGVERESLMAKTLFAVDELSGLVVALARVRPGNFLGMSAKSVRKAMKKKDFAAAINRDDIRQGMEELGLKEDDVEGRNNHLELVIKALDDVKDKLGF